MARASRAEPIWALGPHMGTAGILSGLSWLYAHSLELILVRPLTRFPFIHSTPQKEKKNPMCPVLCLAELLYAIKRFKYEA